jgi:hypothetical protein
VDNTHLLYAIVPRVREMVDRVLGIIAIVLIAGALLALETCALLGSAH